jgi:hypothetical protein
MPLAGPFGLYRVIDTLPGVSFNRQEVLMSRTEDRSFEGVLNPAFQGVFWLVVTAGGERIDDLIAVDYPMEYRDVDNDPEFLKELRGTGVGYIILSICRLEIGRWNKLGEMRSGLVSS